MKHAAIAALMALSASACMTTPASGPTAPAGATATPTTSLDLGDWRHASAEATLSHFESEVQARYAVGAPVAAAGADLRRNDFTCAANTDQTNRGDPPAQICRKTLTADNCTNTWQVHLFGAAGHLTRVRALYDRRCGGDGLLGGPG